MKLTQITVSYGQTQSLPEYSNVKPSVTLTATIEEGDDPSAVEALLWQHAKQAVYEEVDRALELNGLAAKYSTEPRFQVMRTYWDSYLNRGKPELPKLVVILPNDLDPDKQSLGTGLIHSGYPESRKLRYQHALRVAADSARDLGATILDCADGDITPLIAALAVTEPEVSVAEPVAYGPPVDDWTSPLDEEIEDDDDELDEDAEQAEREHELTKEP